MTALLLVWVACAVIVALLIGVFVCLRCSAEICAVCLPPEPPEPPPAEVEVGSNSEVCLPICADPRQSHDYSQTYPPRFQSVLRGAERCNLRTKR